MQTVAGWLHTLPDAVMRTAPYLSVIEALGLFFANKLEAAERCLHAAETRFSASASDDRSRSILGYAMVIRASIARYRGDLARCITLARQALELLPPTDTSARMPAGVHLAQAYLLSGDVSPTNEHLVTTQVARARASGELTGIFYAIVTLAGLQRRQGRLRQATMTYREAYAVAAVSGGPAALVNGAAYYFGLGDLLREWNDLDAAADLLLQGRTIVLEALATQAETLALGYIALARLQQAQGDGRDAMATLDEFEQVARQRHVVPEMLARGGAARAQLALVQEDLPTAVWWADTSGLQVDDDLSYVCEHEYLTLARVRIAQGRNDPARSFLRDALQLLARLLDAAEHGGRADSVIEILVLQALACHAQGDLSAALAVLDRALTLAAPEGYVRVFVDEGAPMAALLAQGLGVREWGMGASKHDHGVRAYGQHLLAVYEAAGIEPPVTSHVPTSEPPALTLDGEVLTARELEVLRLLVAGRSNQAMAEELVVAVGTVKRHVSNIMSNLRVQSRLEAVARARELHIV
jgi:LuxR family maltose regulon positive regulatory protein